MDRVGDRVAVRVAKPLRKPSTTFAMFEMAGGSQRQDGGTMSNALGMMIESPVAVLLILTIGYCMMLNRRLKLLKGDEDTLRVTIAELVTATEIAERAIAGLKLTAHECEAGLGDRLNRAERLNAELDRKLATSREVLGHLSQIAIASRRTDEPNAPLQNAQAIAAQAQAFAERLRSKVLGLAA